MQQGDFGSSYYPYAQSAANPVDYQPPPPPPPSAAAAVGPSSYASAPPFSSTAYGAADYPQYPQNYPPFPHSSDPVPNLSSPTAPPSYPPPPPPAPQQPPAPQYLPPSQAPDSLGFYPLQSAQQQPPLPAQYPPYDPPQPAANYPPPPSSSYPGPNSSSGSSLYPSNFGNASSSGPSLYESPYESGSKFDDSLSRYGGYGTSSASQYGDYGRSRSDLGSEIYGNRPESGVGGRRGLYDSGMYADEGCADGVYAYKGKSEPYGARGTAPKSSTWSGMFDDYGRAISFPTEREKSTPLKVVRAVPKAEAQTDTKSGVQKFRVKLLPESGIQGVMDVLCQVGLDGIRMLDPSTSRTLRIYPLENVTRCDKFDSSTFAFWSKTSVDIEPRRIRLQSNSYTTNTILDTVTAAIVQFKEMGGRSMPPESSKLPEKAVEKKKGLTDWMVKLKPINEEKDHWVPDEAVSKCTSCGTDFSAFVRKHHCRNCGDIFCDKCTQGRTALTADENAPDVRVCDRCMAEVTRRLSNAKEAASRSTGLQSHEDLAKKLQEEMEKNRRASSGSKSDGSGRRMREVACPTCTVHLQVQVPSSGSETIECGVCQNPFLVSAH